MQAITSLEQFKAISNGRNIISFWASWSKPSVAVNNILTQLEKNYKNITFYSVEAEEYSEISELHKVASVPTVLFLVGAKETNRLVGANPQELNRLVSEFSSNNEIVQPSPNAMVVETATDLNARLKALINQHKVMGFIKGTPSAPQCGFSRKFCEVLQTHGVKFETFNILSDQEVREGLKKYSNWPTYPQLYVNGELVGGLDIINELVEAGEFMDLFK